MPDYDPKSIPILDDIIEHDKTEPEQVNPGTVIEDESTDSETIQDDSTLDLFDNAAADTADETEGPELGSIARFLDTADASTDKAVTEEPEIENAESALIDYHPETEDSSADDAHHQAEQQENFQNIEHLADESVQTEPVRPASLDAIVDDVVKQLLPDLEQQLRLLVQQALEEKLPAEIIEQISADEID